MQDAILAKHSFNVLFFYDSMHRLLDDVCMSHTHGSSTPIPSHVHDPHGISTSFTHPLHGVLCSAQAVAFFSHFAPSFVLFRSVGRGPSWSRAWRVCLMTVVPSSLCSMGTSRDVRRSHVAEKTVGSTVLQHHATVGNEPRGERRRDGCHGTPSVRSERRHERARAPDRSEGRGGCVATDRAA